MARWLFTLALSIGFLSGSKAQEAVPAWAKNLDTYIVDEMRQEKIPSVAIAVVDDQKVVFTKTYGYNDLKKTQPTTAETVYRVGSISKLLTALCALQLVEEGKLDLDANVTKYIPDFMPETSFKTAISVRHLLDHKSGLMRESPAGNLIDSNPPSFERAVLSLNGQPLFHEPGTSTKYSNSGIALVGLILEKIEKKPFFQVVQDRILSKLEMSNSSFAPSNAMLKRRAKGVIWTYHGREFEGSTWEPGLTASEGLSSTIGDMAKFIKLLNRSGAEIVKRESFDQILKAKSGINLGFFVSEAEGRKAIGQFASLLGFTGLLIDFPSDKLGVIVLMNKDIHLGSTLRISNAAKSAYFAERQKGPQSEMSLPTKSANLNPLQYTGRYEYKEESFDVSYPEGRMLLFHNQGGFWREAKPLNEAPKYQIVDGRSAGSTIELLDNGFKLQNRFYAFAPVAKTAPSAPHTEMLGLIGEYGPDHNILYIFEKDGKLWSNIHWVELMPMIEEKKDVYRFPLNSMYAGEKMFFERDAKGKATSCVAAGMTFKRRKLDGEDGQTFKVELTRMVKELEGPARAAKPPEEKRKFRDDELVELATLDPGFKFDLRYATENNFLGTPVYPKDAKGYMQKPAAEALVRVLKRLKEYDLGLMIFDPYRPWYVTKIFRDAVPPKFYNFVANPAEGSRHNRGCAVDLGLYDLKTGKYVDVVGGYDEFSDRAYPNYIGGTSRQRWHRDLLRRMMEAEGFTVINDEWWHFDYKDWKEYRIGNQTFEQLRKGK